MNCDDELARAWGERDDDKGDAMDPNSKLLGMRTWALGNQVYMLTSWASDRSDRVDRFVLQLYDGGAWCVVRSWWPGEDPALTALAQFTCERVEGR